MMDVLSGQEHHETDTHFLDQFYGIIPVPWKNKEEWLDVYKKAYSANLSDQMEAYNMMIKWQERKRGCPLGVTSTCIMLQGVIKDKEFHSEIQNCLADEDLQFIYGGSITRFLNFIGLKEADRAYGEERKGMESMYVKAQKIGLPDWIVNVRHDVSHGTVLPEIGLLRLCVIYILKILKSWYWEVEEKKLHDVILKRPRNETIMESFMKLLNVYVLVKEQQKSGKNYFKNAMNSLVRKEISNIENYRLIYEQLENAPWEIRLKKKKKLLTEQELEKYPLNKIAIVVVKYIKEYNQSNHIDMWNIIVKEILKDSIKYKSLRLNIWSCLIKILTDTGYVCKFLDSFMIYVFEDTNNFDLTFWAKKWLTVYLQALLKRSKVEKLKLALIEKVKKGKFENKILSSLSSLELDRLKQQITRTQTKLSKQKKLEIYSTLSHIVEKKYQWMRTMLRFTCSPLDASVIELYLIRVCDNPNDFTNVAIDFFIDMLDKPSTKFRKSLKKVINIYQGKEVIDGKCSKNVITLPDVLTELGITEEEYSDDESVMNLTKITNQHSENDGKNKKIYAIFESPSMSAVNSSWPQFFQFPWSS